MKYKRQGVKEEDDAHRGGGANVLTRGESHNEARRWEKVGRRRREEDWKERRAVKKGEGSERKC